MIGMHNIQPSAGSRKTKKRVGRGLGSTGTYSGRGVKGQSARSGVSGLQLKGMRHILLSIPKARGFKSQKPKPATVTLATLDRSFKDGEIVTPAILEQKHLIRSAVNGVKVLATGNCTKKLTLKQCLFSEEARQKLTASGSHLV